MLTVLTGPSYGKCTKVQVMVEVLSENSNSSSSEGFEILLILNSGVYTV